MRFLEFRELLGFLAVLNTGSWIWSYYYYLQVIGFIPYTRKKKKEIDISIKINTKKKRILNCLSSLMYVEKGLNLYTLSIVLLELI